jgi:hypothetical protein
LSEVNLLTFLNYQLIPIPSTRTDTGTGTVLAAFLLRIIYPCVKRKYCKGVCISLKGRVNLRTFTEQANVEAGDILLFLARVEEVADLCRQAAQTFPIFSIEILLPIAITISAEKYRYGTDADEDKVFLNDVSKLKVFLMAWN